MTTKQGTSQQPTDEQRNNPTTNDNSAYSNNTTIVNEKIDDDAYFQCEKSPVAIIKHEGNYRGIIGRSMMPEIWHNREEAIKYYEENVDWITLRHFMYYEVKDLLDIISNLSSKIDKI